MDEHFSPPSLADHTDPADPIRSAPIRIHALLPLPLPPLSLRLPASVLPSAVVTMANPNVQKVPKLLLQLNEWQAQGRLDKAHGQALNGQRDAVQTERTDAGRDKVDETERKRRARC